MGRRSRKAGPARPVAPPSAPEGAPAAPPPPRAPVMGERRARMGEAPPAPWSPFPLVELCILVGIVMIIGGFAFGGDRRGVLLTCGFALVALASLELTIREHFAGYRSHTALLALFCALATIIPLSFLQTIPKILLLVLGVAVFAAVFLFLRRVFTRRSGGLGFRA